MITFMYRWNIPPEQREEFKRNWEELTREVREKYGMHTATLYECNGDLLSVTHWPSEQVWEQWKTELRNHPYRAKWRPYRISGPDRLKRVVRVGPELEGA